LEGAAYVNYERARDRWCWDPAAGFVLYFEPLMIGCLQEIRQEGAIFMRTDSLRRCSSAGSYNLSRGRRIFDEFEFVLLRYIEEFIECGRRELEGFGYQ
jgi:hypothetical protein